MKMRAPTQHGQYDFMATQKAETVDNNKQCRAILSYKNTLDLTETIKIKTAVTTI